MVDGFTIPEAAPVANGDRGGAPFAKESPMPSVSPRGKALLLLLATLLAVPWSVAAAPRRAAPPRAPAQEPAPAVSLTVRLGSWLRSLWGKAGADIDPDGRAAVRPALGPAGGTQAGTNIDPNGLATGDAGTNIDPDG